MFGYIRPMKPQMKICEYDAYKAIYCGLCKELSDFGFVSRFTLSYDFTFLALLHIAISDDKLITENQVCMAHPIKKSPCLTHCPALTYTAAMACISVYHKLRDDKQDIHSAKKAAAAGLLSAMKKPYKKAKALFPQVTEIVEKNMILQANLEKENNPSIDMAAEPTAKIMEEMMTGITDNPSEKQILGRIGYLLGRYVYISDALDDAEDDFKNGSYNPLLLLDRTKSCDMDKIREFAKDNIMFTLGELANAYTKLDVKRYKPIIDNVIYLGLPSMCERILKGEKITKIKSHNP